MLEAQEDRVGGTVDARRQCKMHHLWRGRRCGKNGVGSGNGGLYPLGT